MPIWILTFYVKLSAILWPLVNPDIGLGGNIICG
jgi:hypothetical protein